MIREIKKVEYVSEYKLKLYFTNGKIKIFDMEDLLRKAKNMFLPLKDIEFFKKVKCDYGTIIWPNGVDLCPDVLYKEGKEFPSERKRAKKSVHSKSRRKKLPANTYGK